MGKPCKVRCGDKTVTPNDWVELPNQMGLTRPSLARSNYFLSLMK
jgi:hypothetical protein